MQHLALVEGEFSQLLVDVVVDENEDDDVVESLKDALEVVSLETVVKVLVRKVDSLRS